MTTMPDDRLKEISKTLNTNSLDVPAISDADYKNSEMRDALDELRAKCSPPNYFPYPLGDNMRWLGTNTTTSTTVSQSTRYKSDADGYYFITVSTKKQLIMYIENKEGQTCSYVVQDCDGKWATSAFTLYLPKGYWIYFSTGSSRRFGRESASIDAAITDEVQIEKLPPLM